MVHYAATVGYRVRRTVCAVGFFLFFSILCWVKWLFLVSVSWGLLSYLVIRSDPSESVSHF